MAARIECIEGMKQEATGAVYPHTALTLLLLLRAAMNAVTTTANPYLEETKRTLSQVLTLTQSYLSLTALVGAPPCFTGTSTSNSTTASNAALKTTAFSNIGSNGATNRRDVEKRPAERSTNRSAEQSPSFGTELSPLLEAAGLAAVQLLEGYQTARLHILYGLDETANAGKRSGDRDL
eukprot:13881-Heterococcus_DN1.PRE.2